MEISCFLASSLLVYTTNHQCCGPGSGIRCLFDPGIRNRFFPDPGSRIPDPSALAHIFESLMIIFWVQRYIIHCKLAQIFFFTGSKIIFNLILWYLWLQKNVQQFFFTPLFCCCFWFRDPGFEIRDPRTGIREPGSENRDPRSEIRDPGCGMDKTSVSGINIPDPQHCYQ